MGISFVQVKSSASDFWRYNWDKQKIFSDNNTRLKNSMIFYYISYDAQSHNSSIKNLGN